MWYRTNKSKSFTRKGPGRQHDYSGVARKIDRHVTHTLSQERKIRARCGALTKTFAALFYKFYKYYPNYSNCFNHE